MVARSGENLETAGFFHVRVVEVGPSSPTFGLHAFLLARTELRVQVLQKRKIRPVVLCDPVRVGPSSPERVEDPVVVGKHATSHAVEPGSQRSLSPVALAFALESERQQRGLEVDERAPVDFRLATPATGVERSARFCADVCVGADGVTEQLVLGAFPHGVVETQAWQTCALEPCTTSRAAHREASRIAAGTVTRTVEEGQESRSAAHARASSAAFILAPESRARGCRQACSRPRCGSPRRRHGRRCTPA